MPSTCSSRCSSPSCTVIWNGESSLLARGDAYLELPRPFRDVVNSRSFSRSDYINPIDLCNRLNAYIIPEAAVHAFLTFLFVINGYWLAILLNLPLLAFNAKKYVALSSSHKKRSTQQEANLRCYRIYENQHLLDATEIFRKLNVHKKVGFLG